MNQEPQHRYTAALAARIEAYWQEYWDRQHTVRTANPVGPLSTVGHRDGEPTFVLDMFPYPSGDGLHVGHLLGYVGSDCYGRFMRMTGHNVLHAMGFDAFGLPAEQHAAQTGETSSGDDRAQHRPVPQADCGVRERRASHA